MGWQRPTPILPCREPHAMRNRLDSITIRGLKTIRQLDGFRPGPLAVLIGPNGAGKSNFVSFFRMMSWMLADHDNLRLHVAQQGGASKLLHNGSTHTREIEAEITIQTSGGENQYSFRIFYAAGDTFVFADEKYRFSAKDFRTPANWREMDAGHTGPKLLKEAATDDTARFIRNLLRRINVYQFHDTSYTARMRANWQTNDNRYLKEDAANIAPVLLRLKENDPEHHERIVDTIRLILPFFSNFELEPENGHIRLAWRERSSDIVFDVSQASDGMLRVIALVTLLLQPEESLPDVVVLDEPELGLHPYAITVIGGLIRAASTKVQVIAATQSTSLVDQFDPEHVVVVERNERESTFQRLDPERLQDWLEDYSLSELWEKNVIGGRP